MKKTIFLVLVALSFYSCGESKPPVKKPKVIDPLKAIVGKWEAKVISERLRRFNISLPVVITFNKDNTYTQSFTEFGKMRRVKGKYTVSKGIVLKIDIKQTSPRRAMFKGVFKLLDKNMLKLALINTFVGERPLYFTDSNTDIYHRVGDAGGDIYVVPVATPRR